MQQLTTRSLYCIVIRRITSGTILFNVFMHGGTTFKCISSRVEHMFDSRLIDQKTLTSVYNENRRNYVNFKLTDQLRK